METILSKWGNSLGVRLPASLAQSAGLKAGSAVVMKVKQGKLTLEPVQHSLAAMLAEIDDQNTHREIETGAPIGKEAW